LLWRAGAPYPLRVAATLVALAAGSGAAALLDLGDPFSIGFGFALLVSVIVDVWWSLTHRTPTRQ
jgi:hypothetical protein